MEDKVLELKLKNTHVEETSSYSGELGIVHWNHFNNGHRKYVVSKRGNFRT